jgi:hypothetical protein
VGEAVDLHESERRRPIVGVAIVEGARGIGPPSHRERAGPGPLGAMSMKRILLAILCLPGLNGRARADQIYDVSAAGSFDFVPTKDDGTPNRPYGSHLGNEITFAGTDRYLTDGEVVLSRIGPVSTDSYTLDLYKADGSIDPVSGLVRPGTLIGSYTTTASNAFIPGTGAFVVDWNFAPILVPDTVIAVVGTTYGMNDPNVLVGPFAAVMPPLTGTALNTIWYGDGTPSSWTADPNWAINDGGVTNYLDMRFDARAVPAPGSLALIGIGLAGFVARAKARRTTYRA